MKGSEPSIDGSEKTEKQGLVIGYYGSWVRLTYVGTIIAVIGMYLALSGSIGYAVICLMFCGLCDMLDGPAARRKKRTERQESYGIQIDALADVVSFAVFPVMIGFSVGALKLSRDYVSFEMILGIGIAAIYILAAVIRLAYFNVIEIELQNRKEKRKYYEGMPVTFVAILIPLVYSLCLSLEIPFSSVYNVMLFLFAIAFVTRVKIRKLRGKQLLVFLLIGLPIAIFLVWNIGTLGR